MDLVMLSVEIVSAVLLFFIALKIFMISMKDGKEERWNYLLLAIAFLGVSFVFRVLKYFSPKVFSSLSNVCLFSASLFFLVLFMKFNTKNKFFDGK